MSLENDREGPHLPQRRTRLVRSYPVYTLEDALSIAATIQETNAGLPFDRILLAGALGTTPASSGFSMRLNSSAKYGLTVGGYNDTRISLTPLGAAIVAPEGQEELHLALAEAAMKPDLFARFHRMLDGKRLPEDAYAQNMLQRELGVNPSLSGECLGIIKANGVYVGILSAIGDKLYVDLSGISGPSAAPSVDSGEAARSETVGPAAQRSMTVDQPPSGKIFIGHAGNREAVRFVEQVLDQLGIPHEMVVEAGDAGEPPPFLVSDEMRSCSAAILVFADNRPSGGATGKVSLEKMLYQLGAASALYGDKTVILRETGVEVGYLVPSIRSVEFDRDRPEAAGLALISELQMVGAIKVTV